MARATSSLPVPDSPVISTDAGESETRAIILYTSSMAGVPPTSTSSGSSESDAAAARPLRTKRETKPSAAKTSHSISHVTGSSSTIMRRGWSGSICYSLQSRRHLGINGKRQAKHRALALFTNDLDPSTMFDCNLASNGQTKAASRLFCRPHRFEQMFNCRGFDTQTTIAEQQFRAADDPIESGRNLKFATLWHCIDAVVSQIKNELKEAIAITQTYGQIPVRIH